MHRNAAYEVPSIAIARCSGVVITPEQNPPIGKPMSRCCAPRVQAVAGVFQD